MGHVRTAIQAPDQGFDYDVRAAVGRAPRLAMPAPRGKRLGAAMNDLLYIGLTIVIFALLSLIVKGVEHFER
jgi:hypothetical protein